MYLYKFLPHLNLYAIFPFDASNNFFLQLSFRGMFLNKFCLIFNSMVAIPIYLKHNIFYREGSAGRFDVSVSAKSTMGKSVSTRTP